MKKNLKSTVFSGAISSRNWLEELKKHGLSEEDEKKLKETYHFDQQNDIITCDAGAIYSCADATNASEKAIANWYNHERYQSICEARSTDIIINEKNYNLELVQGEFPFINYKNEEPTISWSTHIIVIQNYKKLLDKKEEERRREFEYALQGANTLGKEGCKLNGAISSNAIFPCLNFQDNYDIDSDWADVCDFVPNDDFQIEKENGIFANENGAVLNAFDFSQLSEHEKELAQEITLSTYESKYPNYKLTLKEGNFPIAISKTTRSLNQDIEVSMSSHILYVQNYKQCLTADYNNATNK